MKAIILSGGKGTRLMPLTAHTPKPMLPIGGKPHLEHIIRLLKAHGFNEIILSTGYLHKEIVSHFGNGENFGVNIQYKEDGDNPLGTAGAIKNCEDLIEDGKDFLVFNGDILTNIDLSDMIRIHKQNTCSGNKSTIALAPVEDPRNFGVVVKGEHQRISSFIEKPSSDKYGNHINAGIYILNKNILNTIPKNEFAMIENDVFPYEAEVGNLFYYLNEGAYWLDIGTHERYSQANVDYSSPNVLF